jgi:cytochrome c-type biogenesis protein CcmE
MPLHVFSTRVIIASSMQNKNTFFAASLLILAAVGYLIISNTGDTAQYFMTVEELHQMQREYATQTEAESASLSARNITLSGGVLGDTIIYEATVPSVTFTLVHVPGDPQAVERAGGLATIIAAAARDPNAPRVEVVYEGVKPDMLQHEAQPIMRGHIAEDGRFHAEEILFKCPSRYQEAGSSDAR